jgi:hypothetical protein
LRISTATFVAPLLTPSKITTQGSIALADLPM